MLRTFFAAGCIAVGAGLFGGAAFSQDKGAVKIGVLTDMGGPLSDIAGKGSLVAALMAVEDFGGSVLGQPITVVSADHQNKPDIGSSIARRWLDADGVDTIVDVPASSVGLAVQQLTKEKGKIFINTAGSSADFTGPACSPFATQWAVDTYTMANGITSTLVGRGFKDWYLLAADYTFGLSLERDARTAIVNAGGKVLGSAKHPLGANDFSSFILQAQSSGAKVVGLANGSLDTVQSIQQAREFGLPDAGIRMVAFTLHITDVRALGVQAGQGTQYVDSFYWKRTEETEKWARRFMAKHGGNAPTAIQASVYSGVSHYLKSVKAAETKDAMVVSAKMKELPINDAVIKNGSIRSDGKVMREYYLLEVKKPSDVTGDWDFLKVVETVAGESVTRSLAAGGCPLGK